MQRALGGGEDVAGLVPSEALLPPASQESTSSTSIIERAALAIVRASMRTPGDEEPDIAAALYSAGIPAEMYEQIAAHPDFTPALERCTQTLIALPRLPRIISSITNSAMAGDNKTALRWVEGQKEDSDYAGMVRDWQASGPERMLRELDLLILQYREIRDEVEATKPDPALVAEAVAEIAQEAGPAPERTSQLGTDHLGWAKAEEGGGDGVPE